MARQLSIDSIYGNCPVQAEGHFGGERFYFRSRGARWSMNIGGRDVVGNPDWRYEEPYGEFPDAGYITEDQARDFINKAILLYCQDKGYKEPTNDS
jgi:hypothetical protein